MKKSISRAELCRQRDLHEVSIGVSGGLAPVATGLDKAFIRSITRESEGLYNIRCWDRANRALIPVLLSMADASTLANFVSSDEESIKVQSRTLVALAAVKAEVEIQDLTFTADTAGDAGNGISLEYVEGSAKASLVVGDITYEAVARGVAGNDIEIEYLDTGTAGAEVVTVVGTVISVSMEAGVSTATQIKDAIDAETDATALVTATISGTAGDAQVAAASTPLAGGGDIVISVVGDAIEVGIETGEHTAAEIKTAIEADVGAAALVDVSISGAGATVQVLQEETFLEGGHDAWNAGDPVDASYNFKFLWHQAAHVY